jgi:hypothetical protein
MIPSPFVNSPWLRPLVVLACVAFALPAAARQGGERSPWEKSIVTVEVTRKQYDFIQPWTQRNETFKKQGVVFGPGQVLTTADYLNDLVLARLQKDGRGKWYAAKLAWIDYHANLALLTAADTNFWNGLNPDEVI